MSKKPITSLEAAVRHAIEELYQVCRTGKILIINKLRDRFNHAKAKLDERIESDHPELKGDSTHESKS